MFKSSTFWDIKPCTPLKIDRRFGGTCRHYLQNRRIILSEKLADFKRTARVVYQKIGLFLIQLREPQTMQIKS
jgi:hypothetical protein